LTIVPFIVSEHCSEAAFLWLLRDTTVHQPNYALRHLARLDNRIEAHLDGLRVAGVQGASVALEEAVANPEPGELFALASCAFELNDTALIDQVLALAAPDLFSHRAVASALGWLELAAAKKHILALFERSQLTPTPTTAAAHAIAVAAAAIHRWDPGLPLATAANSPDASTRARALRAIGELGLTTASSALRAGLTHAEFAVRAAAAWSSVLLGDASALPILKECAVKPHPLHRRLANLAFRRTPPAEARAWRLQLAGDPKTHRLAMFGAGAVGDPVAVPWLIELMKTDATARAAGESFTMITGADLAFLDLERKPPADFDAGPTEDPADPNVESDPDGVLPWPDERLVRSWWAANSGRFAQGQQFLFGRPVSDEAGLRLTLRDGFQRHRAAAALELALRKPGTPLFEARARADRQRAMLGA